jgi:hypothetical protein
MATRTSSAIPPTYKPKVRYKGGTQYDVQSRTRPDHIHHVDTYRLTCTCEAGRWGKRCWVMAAALQFEAWRKHELAKAQAAGLGRGAGSPRAGSERSASPEGRAAAPATRSAGMSALQGAVA